MADGSKIEWTDATWNPVTGCSVVSPGCTNCYAMKLAGGRLRNHPSRAGLTEDSKAGPVWNGEVRLNEDWLNQPLRWKRPRTIFVCAHGDLFHEAVPDEWIDQVFAVMALAQGHRFQVLTKRSERMRDYIAADPRDRINGEAGVLMHWDKMPDDAGWPLPNVWMGVSVEDNDRRDRLDHLRETPAAVRFLSAEPLIGPLSIAPWLDMLDWVIMGGESGNGARPMHPEWVRTICGACLGTGTPFFFKQWGAWLPGENNGWYSENDRERGIAPHAVHQDGTRGLHPASSTAKNYVMWEPDGTLRHGHRTGGDYFKVAAWATNVGKKRAGRMLDGREWNEMPA